MANESPDKRLPSLEEPKPGTCCPNCGREVALAEPIFCGACADHDRLRDDPLRLEETRLILALAAEADTHSSDREPLTWLDEAIQ
jgi:hypothetical protein